MSSTLWRSSFRYARKHPLLLVLSVLGVALGVAVVVSIDLANASAERAFELSAEGVTGKATHQVVGAAEGLEGDVYRTLRVDLGIRQAAPVVAGYVQAPEQGRTFQVLGVDPLAEAPFRPYVGGQESGVDLGTFMAQPRTALIAQPTAETLGLTLGDTLQVRIEGVSDALRIAGLMVPQDERSRRAMDNLLVVDVATAQDLFDTDGRLTRIDLIVPDDAAGERMIERIEAALPEGAEVVRSASRTRTLEQMTRAFNLNLTALSLLALVVGMFLIYNTMTFSVVQRRALIGRLRALGVTRREVFTLIVGEAALIGVVGTALGLAGGILLGQGLVQLVTQTINDLYYVLSVRELTLAPWTFVKGIGLGLGATILATLPPAREATNAPASTVLQRSQQESQIRTWLPRLAGVGVVLGVVGAGLLLLPSRSIALSYLALLCVILGAALLTPAAVVGLARMLRPLMGRAFGVLGRMAARGVVTTLSRTAVAIAALMVAVAATVGVGVMVDSFRETVNVWLSYSLRADVYVQPPSLVFRRGDATLEPSVVETLKQTEGVRGAYSVRTVRVTSSEGRTDLVAIDQGPNTRRGFRFKAGDPEQVWDRFAQDLVIVSEPFSYRTGVGVGDTLQLQTDRGPQTFPVRGVYYDYGSDLGVVMMSRPTYDRYYDDPGLSGLALYATADQDVDVLVERLRDRVGAEQEVIIRSNRALREASLEVFDRTFTVTVVLRLLAVLVAFIGVLSALMALQLERARELAVLRANGLTPKQVWRYVTMQTGVMGLIAGILSLPLGLILASVLIYVINKRSFGWTLQFEVAPEILLQALALALVAALLAGLYPSKKMAQANPAMALREE
jgi:putative ABC transport system permease protein